MAQNLYRVKVRLGYSGLLVGGDGFHFLLIFPGRIKSSVNSEAGCVLSIISRIK